MQPCPGPPPPSPEPLARLALAMELSRRVAWLGGSLAGLSVEHVHSFTPWIQAHGGWVSIGGEGTWGGFLNSPSSGTARPYTRQ